MPSPTGKASIKKQRAEATALAPDAPTLRRLRQEIFTSAVGSDADCWGSAFVVTPLALLKPLRAAHERKDARAIENAARAILAKASVNRRRGGAVDSRGQSTVASGGVLFKWARSAGHVGFPYPTAQEKVQLMAESGKDAKTLNMWFKNYRRRHW